MNRDTSHEAATHFECGSGNVFADLGLPEPEVRLAKAELAASIAQILERQGLSGAAAANILGLDEVDVGAILRGRLSGFTRDLLSRCVDDLQSTSVLSKNADRVKL